MKVKDLWFRHFGGLSNKGNTLTRDFQCTVSFKSAKPGMLRCTYGIEKYSDVLD